MIAFEACAARVVQCPARIDLRTTAATDRQDPHPSVARAYGRSQTVDLTVEGESRRSTPRWRLADTSRLGATDAWNSHAVLGMAHPMAATSARAECVSMRRHAVAADTDSSGITSPNSLTKIRSLGRRQLCRTRQRATTRRRRGRQGDADHGARSVRGTDAPLVDGDLPASRSAQRRTAEILGAAGVVRVARGRGRSPRASRPKSVFRSARGAPHNSPSNRHDLQSKSTPEW